MAENTDQYGTATRRQAKSSFKAALKKDVKEGRVSDGSNEKTSTQTPDPNVDSLGDTLPATDTATGTTGTTTTTVTTRNNSSGS